MDSESPMDKAYQPAAIEQKWYTQWEAAGYFAPSGRGTPYCIMIPPPNVTGTLHMGHAFQHTLQDALTRFHRMRGDNVLWQPGTDHAGIATQMVVERQLNAEGKTRQDLGREDFLARVWQWKQESGGTISRQMRRLGNSVDWSRDRFTMDEGLSQAVTEVFVRLHAEGLIYRGKRLVNWDPVLHTALSDLEVQSEAGQGSLWHFRYPLADGSGHLVVATTRPETMLGDTAVAVNPADARYRDLVGKQIRLPLTGRLIPVIADDYVDPEFGSGCVKITPGHDFNDYEVGKRHDLPLINIFDRDAKILSRADAHGSGYDPAQAFRRNSRRTARHGSLRRPQACRRTAGGSKPGRAHRRTHPADPARRPQQRRARALAHRSVVREDRAAGRTRHRGRRRGPHPLRTGKLDQDLLPVDAQHPGLVHQPAAVVGPPHTRLV